MIEQIEELNGQINVSGNVVGTIIGQNCSGGGGSGGGDMYKSVYDKNDNGIVDNAEKVNNHTVLSDVPANAVFTDTTYTAGTGIDITNGVISNTQTSAEWGNISGNLSDQTDLKNALDSKANSSSIPTKISDLTNDSNFIETSQTSGLIKNDGTIDTTSYSTFSGNYNDLSNKPTIPTKTSDLSNDSEFKSVGIGDNHGSATEDIYIEKQYNHFTNNVVISDNLNGVTLDLGFPEMGETPIMFEDPYTSSYNYNTEYPIIESNNYAVMFWHGNVTGFGYMEHIYLKDKLNDTQIADFYWASEISLETSIQSYTLPSDFGTVTGIDNIIGAYPYIKKIVYVYDYSDVYFKENNSYKKINNKGVEIPISNTAPLNPNEDDLWIDTSDGDRLKYYDGSVWQGVSDNIAGDTLPIGTIVPYSNSTAPTNWLVCDGSAVSRTTYADLFSVIGTAYGSGDGSTTFNLPNLKGKVPVGQDTNDTDFDTIGETGGSKELQEHKHQSVYGSMYASNDNETHTYDGVGFVANGAAVAGAAYYETRTAGTGDSGNLQPYQVVCYIIKANQSAGVVAQVENTLSNSQTNVYACDYINDNIGTVSNNNFVPAKQVQFYNGWRTKDNAGYSVDVYGNMQHLTNSDSQWLGLKSYDGTAKFKYYWDTGLLEIDGQNVVKPYTLWTGDSTQSFTMQNSVSSYDYVDIFYHTNDGSGAMGSVRIVGGNGEKICNPLYFWYVNGSIYVKSANISINGTSVVFNNNIQWPVGGNMSSGNYIYITKIVGWK